MKKIVVVYYKEDQGRDPMTVFMYALKAAESRRQYPRRFKMFLDYLKLEGALDINLEETIQGPLRKSGAKYRSISIIL
jgi:hypothetical protein